MSKKQINENQKEVLASSQNASKIDYSVPAEDRPYYVIINGQKIWVNETIYQLYKRDVWAEKAQERYHSRCNVIGERGIKKCDKDCSTCRFYTEHGRTGNSVSLDHLKDEYNFEVEDQSESIVDTLIKKEFYDALWLAVDELDEISSLIIKMFANNYTDSAIARKIGISQPAVRKRKLKALDILREKLKDFYD